MATQEAFDKYVATYQFGVRSVSSSDPVQKLMREIVENALVKSLAAQGMTKASMPKEAFENQIQATIEEKYDALFERATKILALKNEGLN